MLTLKAKFQWTFFKPLLLSLCFIIYKLERGRKEGNVLFNDALNTFYLQLYGVRHMVKNHTDSERGNLLPPHGLLFLISSKGSYVHHPTDRITHTTGFVTPIVEHWLEREIAQWSHHDGSIRPPIAS